MSNVEDKAACVSQRLKTHFVFKAWEPFLYLAPNKRGAMGIAIIQGCKVNPRFEKTRF
jgi:hypothetical protein